MGMVMNALLVHKWVWELVLHTGGKIGKAPLQVAKQSIQHGIVKHCETKYSTPHCLQASVADADASETSTRHIQNLEQILQHKLELHNLLYKHKKENRQMTKTKTTNVSRMRRATRTTTVLLYLVGSTDFHVRPDHPTSYSNHSDHHNQHNYVDDHHIQHAQSFQWLSS